MIGIYNSSISRFVFEILRFVWYVNDETEIEELVVYILAVRDLFKPRLILSAAYFLPYKRPYYVSWC